MYDTPPPVPSEHVLRLVPYVPGKPIAEVKRELGLTDVLKLASNENVLGPSSRAIEALVASAWDMHLYPEGSCHDLRLALASHLHVPSDRLAFGNGSDELIHLLGLAYLLQGDEVLQAEPTFVRYEAAAVLNRAVMVRAPLRDWEYDVAALIERITARTRLIFLANPNNPTGSYLSRSGLESLLEAMPERAVLVLDEAYYEFVDASDYPDGRDYVAAGANVVALRTFSKVYGLAGLRIGYAIARPEIIAAIEQVREPFNVSSAAQAAALAALRDAQHIARSRDLVVQGRRRVAAELQGMGLDVTASQGNFVWVDTGRDGRALFGRLLRLGVVVRTGDIFGAPTHLRITIGDEDQNRRLIGALREALAS